MNLLKEYIRQVLLLQEAKIDDVKARYPALAELIDANFSSLQPKYLEWSAKILSQDPAQETAEGIGELVSSFDELVSRNQIQGSQRDINSFKSLDDLESLVSSFKGKRTARTQKLAKFRQERTQAVEDSIPIFEDDNVFIVVPLSQEASCFYGKSTTWCISYTKAENQWDNYTLNKKLGFVFIIDKVTGEKFALVVDERGAIIEARDMKDNLIDKKVVFDKFAAYQDWIDQGIEQAKSVPANIIANIEERRSAFRQKLKSIDPGFEVKFKESSIKSHSISLNGEQQSYQDPETGKWMPARIDSNGSKWWFDNGELQSFQDPMTKEWMPAIIYPDGSKEWYDKGKSQSYDKGKLESFPYPITGEWMPAQIWADGRKFWYDKGRYFPGPE